MKGKRLLVIDDDITLCRVIEDALAVADMTVYQAHDGRQGLRAFFDLRPDLIILDVHMPVLNGWEVCQRIRELSTTPVIMLTTSNNSSDIIKGLEAGADDFITKPFDAGVLLARVRAVLRRAETTNQIQKPITYQDDYLEISLETRRVLVAGKLIELTAQEYSLLAYFVQNAGLVLSYEQILENVWGSDYIDSTDYVHVYVSHLRRKLEESSKNPQYLLTVHGVGYKLSLDSPPSP